MGKYDKERENERGKERQKGTRETPQKEKGTERENGKRNIYQRMRKMAR